MKSPDQIQLLMEELGPSTEAVNEVRRDGDTAWFVGLEEEMAVGLDFVEAQGKLVLSVSLGAPAPDSKSDCHEFVLVFNFNWVQSGGLKIGLEAPEGDYVLMFELNAAHLDLPTLQQTLLNLAQNARAWRQLIAAGVGAKAASQHLGGSTLSEFIRA
jgi:hypothetical protein